MARIRYLAGTSVFARLTRPAVVAALAPLAASRQVALSRPVVFELGYAARSPHDYREVAERVTSFPLVPTTDADHQRAFEVQAQLAARSNHRAVSLVDALVAAQVARDRWSTLPSTPTLCRTGACQISRAPAGALVGSAGCTEAAALLHGRPDPALVLRART